MTIAIYGWSKGGLILAVQRCATTEDGADPRQVSVGFQRGVEQVLDRELLGEVGAGCLALSGPVRADNLVHGSDQQGCSLAVRP
jgi:hypothetical protein